MRAVGERDRAPAPSTPRREKRILAPARTAAGNHGRSLRSSAGDSPRRGPLPRRRVHGAVVYRGRVRFAHGGESPAALRANRVLPRADRGHLPRAARRRKRRGRSQARRHPDVPARPSALDGQRRLDSARRAVRASRQARRRHVPDTVRRRRRDDAVRLRLPRLRSARVPAAVQRTPADAPRLDRRGRRVAAANVAGRRPGVPSAGPRRSLAARQACRADVRRGDPSLRCVATLGPARLARRAPRSARRPRARAAARQSRARLDSR